MSISINVNGATFNVDCSDLPAEISLNTFLRQHIKLPGTKFMCLQGGCGCCVVNVSTNDSRTFAANSCLLLLAVCDGWEITTIEGIGNKKNGYHPIQKKLAAMNGSQCGYCSPGMIMNMYSLLKANNGNVTMSEVENSFSGNICRCTGYRPILDAMKSFALDSIDIEDLADFGSCSLKKHPPNKEDLFSFKAKDERKWFFPKTVDEVFEALEATGGQPSTFIAGNTSQGVYKRSEEVSCFISLNGIEALHKHEVGDSLVFGANMQLSEVIKVFNEVHSSDGFSYCETLRDHFDLIANVPVRNIGTLAGNLMIKHAHRDFPSDVHVTFSCLGAKVHLMTDKSTSIIISLEEFYETDMSGKLLMSLELPKYDDLNYKFNSYKIMPRAQNAHAIVNSAFLLKVIDSKIEEAKFCFGGIDPSFTRATETENLIQGKELSNETSFMDVFEKLSDELKPNSVLTDPSPLYRKTLAAGLLYKFLLSIIPEVKPEFLSGGDKMVRELSSGSQVYDFFDKTSPLKKPVIKLEAPAQCSGEAVYTNDIEPFHGEVFCAFVHAIKVGAMIEEIDPSEALRMEGVQAFFSAKDIPGVNSFVFAGVKGIVELEELFVSSTVKHYDQPVGVIVAESNELANMAASKVRVMYSKTNYKVLCTMKDVLAAEEKSRIKYVHGLGESKPANPNYQGTLIKGVFDIGTQYPFHMEPQTTVCVPNEDGITVYTATQWMDQSQAAIASMLNVRQNAVHVIVRRIGGSYGGKATRGNQAACACALVAFHLNKPARFIQSLESMMSCLGKRYSNNSVYEVNVNDKGKILSLNNTFYEDFGCSENENPIKVHTLTVIFNCYDWNRFWKVDGISVITDAPSNTFCRAPGSLEGIAMMEYIIEHVAFETGLDPIDVRFVNISPLNKMRMMFKRFLADVEYQSRQKEIEIFNRSNRWRKKGLSIALMEYAIEYSRMYTVTLVVYHIDGSVIISHGGIEMGQGLNTKLAQVAAYTLGVPLETVNVAQSDSFNGANSKVSGASVVSECIAYSIRKCCMILLDRLKPIKQSLNNPTWVDITRKAVENNISLLVSDTSKAGDLKPYSICGCCATEVEVDILTGNVIVQRVDLLQDTGESLNPLIDIGQIEGAYMMGLGYWLLERCVFNKETGQLVTNNTWYYKVPGAKDIPVDLRIELLKNSVNNGGFMGSKATGEPAICLSTGLLFAVRRAIESARKDAGLAREWMVLETPFTPEVIMLACGIDPVNMFEFK